MKTNPLAPDVLCGHSVLARDGVWSCSLEPGHAGDHVAYQNHDLTGEVLAVVKVAPAAKEDGIPAEPQAACEYTAKTGATLIPRLVDHNKGVVMYTNSISGDLHEVSMETWNSLLAVAALQEPEGDPFDRTFREHFLREAAKADEPMGVCGDSVLLPPMDVTPEENEVADRIAIGEGSNGENSWRFSYRVQTANLLCRERQLLAALAELRKLRSQESK